MKVLSTHIEDTTCASWNAIMHCALHNVQATVGPPHTCETQSSISLHTNPTTDIHIHSCTNTTRQTPARTIWTVRNTPSTHVSVCTTCPWDSLPRHLHHPLHVRCCSVPRTEKLRTLMLSNLHHILYYRVVITVRTECTSLNILNKMRA